MIVNSSKAFSSLGQIIYVIAWREEVKDALRTKDVYRPDPDKHE